LSLKKWQLEKQIITEGQDDKNVETPEERKMKNKNDKRKIVVSRNEAQCVLLDGYRFGKTCLIRVEKVGCRFLQKFGTLYRIMRRHIPEDFIATLTPAGASNLSLQGNSKDCVLVTLYRKSIMALNRLKYEINHFVQEEHNGPKPLEV
jgi:hypothetical protein